MCYVKVCVAYRFYLKTVQNKRVYLFLSKLFSLRLVTFSVAPLNQANVTQKTKIIAVVSLACHFSMFVTKFYKHMTQIRGLNYINTNLDKFPGQDKI